MHRWINLHRGFIWVICRDLLVHIKQVSIFGFHNLFSQFGDFGGSRILKPANVGLRFAVSLDRTRVIQKHSLSGFIHPKASVTALLGGT